MTWSVEARGHHNKTYDAWREDEYQILEDVLDAVTKNENIVSSFKFNGNHVQANSVEEARQKIEEYKSE